MINVICKRYYGIIFLHQSKYLIYLVLYQNHATRNKIEDQIRSFSKIPKIVKVENNNGRHACMENILKLLLAHSKLNVDDIIMKYKFWSLLLLQNEVPNHFLLSPKSLPN